MRKRENERERRRERKREDCVADQCAALETDVGCRGRRENDVETQSEIDDEG